MLRVIKTIAKSVWSLLLLYKAKKQKMSPHVGKKRTKKFRFKWSSETMQLAIFEIQQSKLSKKKSAAYYGVPKTIFFNFNWAVLGWKKLKSVVI